ncbi:MAG: fused MFS/spermidine synthase, partial [Sedimentisphaerales bacterium]
MTERRISDSSADRIMLLVLVCFFFSGLTGLIYEILWMRMIVKIIGGAPFAVSIVLTVFMGGLGLGSYLAGRVIDRVKQPIKLVRIYGILELTIGAYGLAIPLLLTAFRPLYAIIYNQLFSYFMLYNILTFIGCSILLCIPVICMGATLPILCRFYVTRLSHLGTHAGRLYGLNTIGAALGALLCGFWLISLLGMPGTLILAVFINGLIGISCLRVKGSVQQPAVEHPISDTQPTEVTGYPPGVVIGALVIFAVSGFCAMSYEVIWAKLLGLIVGPTTYSFTIVLVTFISGLALGSMFFGWLGDKTKRPIWLLISTQIAAGLLVLGISQLLGNSQLFFSKVLFTFKEHFALLSLSKTVILFIFMILPTLCLGATFPLVGKIYTRSVSKVGRSIGVAYAINTVGAVLGSFCAGFVLIPQFGKENSLSLVIGLQLLTSLVIAGIIVIRSKEGILRCISLAVPALAGVILCVYFPVWNRQLLSFGRYHRFGEIQAAIRDTGWLKALLYGARILSRSQRGELVYYGDGIGGFTTVLKYPNPLGSPHYAMIISGKSDASSHADMKTQALSAHFPMLFHRDPKTVMVLGLASGITAGEVLYYPVEQLDVIDISQEVVEASNFFLPWNNNVLSNPRTNLIIQDGRAHLQLTRQRYDVIISEPSNPWMAGLATLFTRDFFDLVNDGLNEDGIFVQFIHSYQMDWPTFALIGRTFVQVFPNSLLVLTPPSGAGGDYLLVGFKGESKLILENAQRKLSYARQSKNITIADPRLLYRLIVSDDLWELFGRGPVNTDSWPRLEFAAPKLMHHKNPMITRTIKSRRWLSPETMHIVQQMKTDVDLQIDFAAYALSVYEPFRDMVDLSHATPSQKERFYKLMEMYCVSNSIDYSIFKDD